MKFSDLIEHCIECIKTFNPVIKTIDSHADEFIKDFKDPYEKVFIKQVFYGCTRYQEFLKIFTKVFFERHSSSTNRNDATLYQIFGYLCFFRLDELQTQDFRKLIMSQESTKMHTFLQFAFNADGLREHLREEWMSLYDFTYIDEKIIGGVERNLPNVSEIIKNVEKRATGKVMSTLSVNSSQMQESTLGGTAKRATSSQIDGDGTRTSHMAGEKEVDLASEGGESQPEEKKITKIVPFNLTKPKPKLIQAPEQIKREIKANPAPRNMNKKTLADIEEDKKQRRMATVNAIKNEYEANPMKRFDLATATRPTVAKASKVKEDVEKAFQDGLKFSGVKPRKMPDFEKNEASVKLTVAALKREKHLIDAEEREEAKKLEEMAMGLKDASEFNRWKAEMNEKDDIERLEHIQKKKIEMELAREQAIIAQKNKEKENHTLVTKMKIESEKRIDEREKNLQEDLGKRKDVIAAVHSGKDAARENVIAKQAENKAIRDEVNKELQEAAKRRADEEAVEQAKKTELIRQIRELEKIPIQRTKGFDPTEAGGHGLMEEMSIAELRERLEFNKREMQQDIDFKREANLRKKEEEAATLMEEASKIEAARAKRKAANDNRRKKTEADAQALAAKKQAIREKGILEAYENINKKKTDKREEEERLAKELKEIKLQRQFLNANAAMVEYKAWQELEAGKERQVRNEQNQRLIEQCKVNQINVKDQTVQATNAKTAVVQKLEYDRGFKERLDTRKKENEVLHKNTLEYKSQMHAKQAEFEKNLTAAQRKANPFIAKMNETSLATANAYKQRQAAAREGQNSLQFDEVMDSDEDVHMAEFGQTGQSALDLIGEAERTADDIQAKMELEV